MLVYDRAYDQWKYMRWGLVYLYDMYELPEKHPDLYQYFEWFSHSVMKQMRAKYLVCMFFIYYLKVIISRRGIVKRCNYSS